MKKTISEAINNQINEELYSAYLYLSMSAFCSTKSLDGFASWFKVQYLEELDHAMGFINYMNERGANVVLQKIKQPPSVFKNITQLFTEALKHEKFITGKIHDLYEMAQKNRDFAFTSFLKWYIDEQMEEEASVGALVDKMDLVGEKGQALYMMDKELSVRKHTPASILSEEE